MSTPRKVFSAGQQFTPGTADLEITETDDEKKMMKALRHAQTTSKVSRKFDTELNQIAFLADKKGYMRKLGGIVAALKAYVVKQSADFETKLDEFNMDHERRQHIGGRYTEMIDRFIESLMDVVKDGVSYNTKHNSISGRK